MINLSIGIILSACIFNQKGNCRCESDSKRKLIAVNPKILSKKFLSRQFWKVDQKMKIVRYFHNSKRIFFIISLDKAKPCKKQNSAATHC